jgi:hypothetical protein
VDNDEYKRGIGSLVVDASCGAFNIQTMLITHLLALGMIC